MNNTNNRYESSRILTPFEFSGSSHGDYGYELNGVRSERGYISRTGARQALEREIRRRFPEINNQ